MEGRPFFLMQIRVLLLWCKLSFFKEFLTRMLVGAAALVASFDEMLPI